MTLREWNARLHGLVVFRALLEDPVVAKLVDLTDRMDAGASGMGLVCDAVAAFEAALFEHTPNLERLSFQLRSGIGDHLRAAGGCRTALPRFAERAGQRTGLSAGTVRSDTGQTVPDRLFRAEPAAGAGFPAPLGNAGAGPCRRIYPADERGGQKGLRHVCQAPCFHRGERSAGAGRVPGPPEASPSCPATNRSGKRSLPTPGLC